MKEEVIWSKGREKFAIIIGVITSVLVSIEIFLKVKVVGITSICLGSFLACLGIREIYKYKNTKDMSSLIMGVILCIVYGLFLYVGIRELQNYIFKVY